jgi:N-glycosidase YbiA
MKTIINFYRLRDPFGEFSNFAPFPIDIKGVVWPTNEHYFQAQKSEDPVYQKMILKVATPRIAADLGRALKETFRKDWDQFRDQVMYEAVYAKFTQHAVLKELLLSTGDAMIVEHTVRDNYWGDGGDGSGVNMLGKTLMRVRESLHG